MADEDIVEGDLNEDDRALFDENRLSETLENELREPLGNLGNISMEALEGRIKKLINRQVVLTVAQFADDQASGVPSGGGNTQIENHSPPHGESTPRSNQTTVHDTSTIVRSGRGAGGPHRIDSRIVGDVIDKFDPDDCENNPSRWLNRIDQLGDIHGWTEIEKTQIMQSKLDGAAKRWFNRLENYNLSWIVWKERITTAFPRRVDYATLLEELVMRRKLPSESMAAYFHAKLAMCERCGVTGERAVSCIIKGLPEELVPNACAFQATDPQTLYNGFLMGVEGYRSQGAQRCPTTERAAGLKFNKQKRLGTVPSAIGQASTNSSSTGKLRRCYNCQEITSHISKDCPKPKITRCIVCSGLGHTKYACPKKQSGGPGGDTGRGSAGGTAQTSVRLVSTALEDTFKKIAYTICGKKLKVYLDTGSQHNLIHAGCAYQLGLSLQPSGVTLKGFGGATVKAMGLTTLTIILDGISLRIEATVTSCDLSGADILLGQPTLTQRGVTLVVRGNKAFLFNDDDLGARLLNISLNDDVTRRQVILNDDVILLPGSTTQVGVEVRGGVVGEVVHMTARLFSSGTGMIAMPNAIFTCGQPLQIHISNLGDGAVKWRKGKVIARCDPPKDPEDLAIEQAAIDLGTVQVSSVSEFDITHVKTGSLSPSQRHKLIALLQRWIECFSIGNNDIGLTNLGEMTIQLTVDKPVYHNPYRLSYAERAVVRNKVSELLEAGIIRESSSNFASPIVLVRKKSGDHRLCVDYRALNAITVKDRYPLPRIEDQLDRLAGKVYYTTLDMAWGYHQVPVHPDSVAKTAFITPDGQFEYLRVPFGLANAPSVFQRIVNKMLNGMQYDEVLAYMDDLLVPSASIDQGLDLLERVLSLVHKAGVKLNLAKCSFLQTSLEYLGHEISAEGVRPGRAKTMAISGFPEPKDVHTVRQFLGLANYFRKFIKDFARIASPLTALTKKSSA